jgi:GNAT superfamily N-acetyltransferase
MAAHGIRIRQAVDSDARGIARVHVDSWRSTYAGILPAEHLAALDYDRREANWRPIIADRRQNVFVAEDQRGRIVGFASGGPERNGNTVYPGELYAIYLIESCQGQGLGRRLVAKLAEWFLSRGWQSMLLWVLGDNPSRRFYEALGGVRIKQATVAIGGTELVEIAYGWSDIAPLTTGS